MNSERREFFSGLLKTSLIGSTALALSLAQSSSASAASILQATGVNPFLVTSGTSPRDDVDRWTDFLNVKDFGAIGDGQELTDTITVSGTAFSCITGWASRTRQPRPGDVFVLGGASSTGNDFVTTVASVQSTTALTLSAPAPASLSASSQIFVYGTDDSAAVQAALNQAATSCAAVLVPGVPSCTRSGSNNRATAGYLVTNLTIPGNTGIYGFGPSSGSVLIHYNVTQNLFVVNGSKCSIGNLAIQCSNTNNINPLTTALSTIETTTKNNPIIHDLLIAGCNIFLSGNSVKVYNIMGDVPHSSFFLNNQSGGEGNEFFGILHLHTTGVQTNWYSFLHACMFDYSPNVPGGDLHVTGYAFIFGCDCLIHAAHGNSKLEIVGFHCENTVRGVVIEQTATFSRGSLILNNGSFSYGSQLSPVCQVFSQCGETSGILEFNNIQFIGNGAVATSIIQISDNGVNLCNAQHIFHNCFVADGSHLDTAISYHTNTANCLLTNTKIQNALSMVDFGSGFGTGFWLHDTCGPAGTTGNTNDFTGTVPAAHGLPYIGCNRNGVVNLGPSHSMSGLTGGTAGAPLLIWSEVNVFTTVGTTTNTCILEDNGVANAFPTTGKRRRILNRGTHVLNILPGVGGFINNYAVNTAIQINPGGSVECVCGDGQHWLAIGLPLSQGTVILNGATPVTVTDANLSANSLVVFTLATVGGTVGAYPSIKTVTPGTGFTVAGTAADTSTYNYGILN